MSEHRDETPAPAAQDPERRGRRLLRITRLHHGRWADEHELGAAVLGTVVSAATMVAASAHGTLGEVVVVVLVTVAVYWAAERYASLLAVASRGSAGPGNARAVLRQGWPMVEAAYTPLAVLVVVALLTDNLRGAVLTALGVATVMLGGLGYVGARRAKSTRAVAVGWGLLSASLGVVVILLKLLLH